MKRICFRTTDRNELIDITAEVRQAVAEAGYQEGICLVYNPHTTCGITVNSIADLASADDLLNILSNLAPRDYNWKHHGNPPDADGHVKSAVVGSGGVYPVAEGTLAIGRYQSILFCEFDGPRDREVTITVIGK